MQEIDKEKLRDLPGWERDAPIPICMGGDYRALTFCCKPGYSLTFGFKCRRDEVLKEIRLTQEEFIKIKDNFSKENDWDTDMVCFGSISYCCMRGGGCPRRDPALHIKYPNISPEEVMNLYFSKKKELAKILMDYVRAKKNDPKVERKLDFLLGLF